MRFLKSLFILLCLTICIVAAASYYLLNQSAEKLNAEYSDQTLENENITVKFHKITPYISSSSLGYAIDRLQFTHSEPQRNIDLKTYNIKLVYDVLLQQLHLVYTDATLKLLDQKKQYAFDFQEADDAGITIDLPILDIATALFSDNPADILKKLGKFTHISNVSWQSLDQNKNTDTIYSKFCIDNITSLISQIEKITNTDILQLLENPTTHVDRINWLAIYTNPENYLDNLSITYEIQGAESLKEKLSQNVNLWFLEDGISNLHIQKNPETKKLGFRINSSKKRKNSNEPDAVNTADIKLDYDYDQKIIDLEYLVDAEALKPEILSSSLEQLELLPEKKQLIVLTLLKMLESDLYCNFNAKLHISDPETLDLNLDFKNHGAEIKLLYSMDNDVQKGTLVTHNIKDLVALLINTSLTSNEFQLPKQFAHIAQQRLAEIYTKTTLEVLDEIKSSVSMVDDKEFRHYNFLMNFADRNIKFGKSSFQEILFLYSQKLRNMLLSLSVPQQPSSPTVPQPQAPTSHAL